MQYDQNQISCFYKEQNMQIRREIREFDMQIKQSHYSNNKSTKESKREQLAKAQINFLVIGPVKSGKTSLIKTMHYALNSNNNLDLTVSELGLTVIKRCQVKKSKKYNVEGLAKLKQTDQKRTVTGFEFQSRPDVSRKGLTQQEKNYRILQRYSNAMQVIDNNVMGCFNPQMNEFKKESGNSFNIKTVLITIDIVSKNEYEEIKCLKSFIGDLREKGLKCLLILTHIDKLNKIKQADRLNLIEERIAYMMKELDIRDRDDVICLQSYRPSKVSDSISRGGIKSYNELSHDKHSSRGVIRGNHFNGEVTNNTSMSDTSSMSSSHKRVLTKQSVKNISYPHTKRYDDDFQGTVKTVRQVFTNNQQINYYSLKLLQKIIGEAERYSHQLKANKIKWFCGT